MCMYNGFCHLFCFYVETGSRRVAQAGSKLMILLPNRNTVGMSLADRPRGQDCVKVPVFLTFFAVYHLPLTPIRVRMRCASVYQGPTSPAQRSASCVAKGLVDRCLR